MGMQHRALVSHFAPLQRPEHIYRAAYELSHWRRRALKGGRQGGAETSDSVNQRQTLCISMGHSPERPRPSNCDIRQAHCFFGLKRGRAMSGIGESRLAPVAAI
jgi:hypothetical protein